MIVRSLRGLSPAAETGSQVNILLALLIQIAIIIIVSRALGLLFAKIRQPLVIGEIIAGIVLGPSLFGLLAPAIAEQLFPSVTAPYLNILAQIGLILFMFLVGLELNSSCLRSKGHTAVVVSHVSIIVPFFLGNLLALFLYESFSFDALLCHLPCLLRRSSWIIKANGSTASARTRVS